MCNPTASNACPLGVRGALPHVPSHRTTPLPTKVIVDDESAGKTGKSKSVGSGGGLHLTSEKMNEIFLIGSSGKVPILITMHQNVDALRFSPLMPIIAQVRVPSAKGLAPLLALIFFALAH